MIFGKWFVSSGFRPRRNGFWHVLVAFHSRWRIDFVKPSAKPGYNRLYVGPIEIEWSRV